jgi:uncharacterized protein YggU (UPF0235/DUF167 family)
MGNLVQYVVQGSLYLTDFVNCKKRRLYMSDRKFEITDARGGVALGVRVVTRADATELVGRNEDNTLKIRLQAKGAGDASANQELVGFLATKLGIDESKIEIVAGESKRDKILSFVGLTSDDVEEKLGI